MGKMVEKVEYQGFLMELGWNPVGGDKEWRLAGGEDRIRAARLWARREWDAARGSKSGERAGADRIGY